MILRADAIGSPLHERRPPSMTRPGYQMISHITSGDCCIAPVSTELGSTSAGLRGRLPLPHTYTKQTTSRGRLQRERVPFTGVACAAGASIDCSYSINSSARARIDGGI